jgi:hypothetical protein
VSRQPETQREPAAVTTPTVNLSFPHCWQAEILAARPPILPARNFVYPAQADEVERGALELMVFPENSGPEDPQPGAAQPFLATCALGFRDPAVPTGIWSTPEPEKICAVSGGYAYIIDTAAPERFSMPGLRPVLEIRAVPSESLLLFAGHRSILAWGEKGQAWESEKLSDEGLALGVIEKGILHGTGWEMISDRETAFLLDLRTGARLQGR